MASFSPEDKKWMRAALGLARRGLGQTAPNPSVGCILVRDGIVVGRGNTQLGGRPHAEVVALRQAGTKAKGSTAYVTLEPCSHYGKTPPCSEALINAGVMRVVAAVDDNDARVSGTGLKMLHEAGVQVDVGLFSEKAFELNKGFFLSNTDARPEFSIKLATSLDGKIALASGESKWITGSEARRYGHMLRAQHDGILVGVNTVLADDPMLDCRIEGLEDRSPARIVLDSKYQTPVSSKLVQSANKIDLYILGGKSNRDAIELEKAGAKIIELLVNRDMKTLSDTLSGAGMRRVLIEGGGQVYASFLKANMCDTLYHFQAGKLLGAESKNGIGELGLAQLSSSPHLKAQKVLSVGDDMLTIYKKPE
ncbi:bifunctional diaminohydroxyphosphoribosylaminopyrimidine deaminase/5-amino-6-(5-phosphoribosylamino)uracil reductase RibD [Kordiimonas laminariae]|uniref:bifunctional diaminohydroxyphosphoribosylaminopyrimidine deaminase/5-amino-6-(5-phosphoribosylamino)uracil reductase RibD n=1 Tax=Kordiimonas laminariae TaxID=2917717 RepID=UPI001FF5E2DF|nr:bifunctional diaminohydroxyphosphoribosylaminopyrimidine deaminase/5-amino-6-(5-phosphoribosylamino)uracil reductase RibD [Kordiimonas laminariae]